MSLNSLGHRLRSVYIRLDGIDLLTLALAALNTAWAMSNFALIGWNAQVLAHLNGELVSPLRSLLPPVLGAVVGLVWLLPIIGRRMARDTLRQRVRYALAFAGWILAMALLPVVFRVWCDTGMPGWTERTPADSLAVISFVLAALAAWTSFREGPRN
jgi:hypothetical protein